MVFCCVPLCGIDSYRSDPSISFHEFPSNPDLAAKWIKQINSAVTTKQKPMWFPRGRPVICSKHFLQTDFKDDSDSLKTKSIPTVFGHKYIGFNQVVNETPNALNPNKKAPLIVKVNKPTVNECNLVITDVFSHCSELNELHDESSKTFPPVSSHSKTPPISGSDKNSYVGSLHYHSKSLQEKTEAFKSSPIVSSINNNIIIKPSTIPKMNMRKPNEVHKKKGLKKDNAKNELIEIGPNTFLKINPEIIKVNKKLTPAGNTVLQFIMDQKLANQANNLLPKIIQTPSIEDNSNLVGQNSTQISSVDIPSQNPQKPSEGSDLVVGHLVDTHVCQETCNELKDLGNDITMLDDGDSENINHRTEENVLDCSNNTPALNPSIKIPLLPEITPKVHECSPTQKADGSYLSKAPVLFTTTLPLSHCLTDKPKYAMQLKQKSRQIASLKLKIGSLNKKVEELENKCIVQERQLSYSFIKRLKTIRKNAAKGDPCATYILEQIRCYTGKTKMRWSDSTLTQCAVWCRKAPYAYEYFKKADFFKLPCLGTVKRYMKKHPELKLRNKTNPMNPDESESSSDFDFDESDSEKEDKGNSDVENIEPSSACEAILSESQVVMNTEQSPMITSKQINGNNTQSIQTSMASIHPETLNPIIEASKCVEKTDGQGATNQFPMTVDSSNIEIQEIILPSGELVQCFASNLCNGTDPGNQYFIIPNVGDQSSVMEQEYNVVQTGEPLPVILQNLDNCQLPMQQEQYIFVTNSTEQVEGVETEVVTAPV
ncbi:THAP-type domain-containing protein [Nephila pilipes]|uniref:THAP-type domain-containing protein n=1 Tax=Nephila pilipes TaxID=299642 RepID=A0A8X6TH88_NEPPI|nr:THAP-type domain-containing protein [Nephila pilipes]